MRSASVENLVVWSLLAGLAAYVILVFVPVATNTELTGVRGIYAGDRFTVVDVFGDSPASSAEIRVGDAITSINGIDIGDWRQWFESDFRTYSREQDRLRDQPIVNYILRDEENLLRTVVSEPVSLVTRFGVRCALTVLLLALIVVILRTMNRERVGFLVMLCLCACMFWLYSDELYEYQFLSPYLSPLSSISIYVNALVKIVSVQLILSILLHITLVFPKPLCLVERNPWIFWPLYMLPLATTCVLMWIQQGSVAMKVQSVYMPNLLMHSGFLVLITVALTNSYRSRLSPLQREQLRWVLGALMVFTLVHLIGWNVPKVFGFQPLIRAYDWLLLIGALIPVSMFFAISRHRLFGVRAMIRRKIRLLERQLDHEKRLVFSRGTRIQNLMSQIEELKAEVVAFSALELLKPNGVEGNTPLTKLETRYPQLETIRKTRLIGASPLWATVFEETVLAAQSLSPVLIIGEPGNGKSDLAWAIHQLGSRSNQPYKAISCAQFQHSDPAIALGRIFGIGTGHGLTNVPSEGQTGLLQECDGGTLFLDDFDRLPLNVQDLLLYPLEGKAFETGIGKGAPISVSVKLILATNQSPDGLVARGLLRGDVLSRLGIRVNIPPLRERAEDIPLLVDYFIHNSSDLEHKVSVVSPKALNLLVSFPYKDGNVRELRSEIRNAAVRAAFENDTVLRAGYLSRKFHDPMPDSAIMTETSGYISADPGAAVFTEALVSEHDKHPPISHDSRPPKELAVLRKHGFRMLPSEEELGFSHKSRTLSNHLRGLCFKAVDDYDGDITQAAWYLAGAQNPELIAKLEVKIKRYLGRVDKSVATGQEKLLFNNLPAVYRNALHNIVEQSRSKL